LLAALAPLTGGHVWLALAAAPLAGGMVWRFWREPVGENFNAILAQTAQVQAVFAMLLCLGLLV
jgi:1,4-dihydroxy-2-naphthoate octaprenyltransferase